MSELVAQELFACEPTEARAKIVALEKTMREEIAKGTLSENTNEMPLDHHFIPGCYARQLTIPAGTLLVGKIHRHPCFNVVLTGVITVLTENGVKTIHAPAFFRSEAGVKRVGLAHSDTVWINIHPSNETNLERLEAEIIAPDFEEIEKPVAKLLENAA